MNGADRLNDDRNSTAAHVDTESYRTTATATRTRYAVIGAHYSSSVAHIGQP